MSFRHFELHDLLCEALIALDAGDARAASTAVGRALRWVEADWLATPTDAPAAPVPTVMDDDADDD